MRGREREKLRRAIDSRVSLDSILDDWKKKEGKKGRNENGSFLFVVPYLRASGGWVGERRRRRREEKNGGKRRKKWRRGGESTTAVSYERLRWRKVARLESPLRESGAGRAYTPRSVALIIKRGLFAVTSFSLMPRSRGSSMGRARRGGASNWWRRGVGGLVGRRTMLWTRVVGNRSRRGWGRV